MATGLSTVWANFVLDHVTGNVDIGTLPTPYVGLSSTKPTDTGTNITEPSTGDYARVACGASQWGPAASRGIANSAVVTFPLSTAAWLAGAAMGYWVLMDAVTAGAMIMWGTVAPPLSVTA